MAVETSVNPTLDGNCETVISPGYAGGAIACFAKSGDHFYLKDTAPDGHYVKVDAIGAWDPNESYTCEDHLGQVAGWTVCSWATSIQDGSKIEWLVGIWEGDKAINFGDDKVSST